MYVYPATLRIVVDQDQEQELTIPVTATTTDKETYYVAGDLGDYPTAFTLSPDPTEAQEGLYLGAGGYLATLTLL